MVKQFRGKASPRVRDERPPGPDDHYAAHGWREDMFGESYVGGQLCGDSFEEAYEAGGVGRFGEPGDWDGDANDLTHELEKVDGLPIARSEISGHFKNERYLREGHNILGGMSMHGAFDEEGNTNFPVAHMGEPRSDAGDMLNSPYDSPDMRGRAVNDNPRLRLVK